ncbi:MAG: hypothetical protein GAK37_03704 [Pseudomonas sp.]|nr:MAG: hypothetical protein GAK37_03704 [Pseudomonas sp.]
MKRRLLAALLTFGVLPFAHAVEYTDVNPASYGDFWCMGGG